MSVRERFLKYISIHTTSDPEHESITPSSESQFQLAKILYDELVEMGASDVYLDEHCYVYATIPAAAGCENSPVIAFLAHMDTAPDFPGENVCPQIIPDYSGENVKLGDSGLTLRVDEMPHLPALRGRTLITTDGTTLLGADDKAGIAEIMEAAEHLLRNEVSHGTVRICFTPDEEIGNGVKYIDLDRLNADFGYTLDGGPEGEVVYENFNAAEAEIEIRGKNIHPGDAKGLMINAALAAMEFNSMLPSGQIPSQTEKYEGFYHLTHISGDVSNAKLGYIIRDHNAGSFEAKKETLIHITKLLNEKYGAGTFTLQLTDQYRNMEECIRPHMQLIENAMKATKKAGALPHTEPIRGGTDGANLSWMGLPCPNLGTGGYAFHGPYEHITVEGMEACVRIVLALVSSFAS